ncbi:cytochrome P450 [Luteolibacter algae]|uniref:Cytochrome P450 n=1 Tax=Luteolibacter algae TaxID=454151 RepID=A0ABW5D6U2_9BACT
MSHSCPHDPFAKIRKEKGVLATEFQGKKIPMILRHGDVKQAAKDWETFSSDAPFRVPIPSEEDVRNVRQLPIETNPPEHKEYRKIVDPTFRKPLKAEFAHKIETLICSLIQDAASRESMEIVREFALPLQSRALTHLLNVPESEAEIWISWGTHVFRDGGDGTSKGAQLTEYLERKFDQASEKPGDDFFSGLLAAEFQGRKLTRDECMGFANLTFAGGRDTIINSVAWTIAYLAEHPEALPALRDDPRLILTATEEIVRVVTPLTHIGRVCPVTTDVGGEKVAAGERVSLCWASANFDETVFDSPEEVRLDRKPNPHVGFGSGTHNCLGAAHARLIIRTLLKEISSNVKMIEILEAKRNIEREADYSREVAYDSLQVKITLA